MVISEHYKFLFVHIGKTGGRSLSTALEEADPLAKNIRELNHGTFLEIRSHIGKEKWNSFFKFSFVRNPYDRTVSLYEFLKQYKSGQAPCYSAYKNYSFDMFLEHIEHETFPERMHFEPQHKFIAESGKIQVDFVGRYENINKDCERVFDLLKLEKRPLPHIYKTDRKHYRSYYSKHAKAQIEKIFGEDLKLFQYEF